VSHDLLIQWIELLIRDFALKSNLVDLAMLIAYQPHPAIALLQAEVKRQENDFGTLFLYLGSNFCHNTNIIYYQIPQLL